jgi:predicted ArsR family transcriptional regulator
LFDDDKCKSLSADVIAKELDISVDEVRRKIAFWVCKGVLKESRAFKQIGTSHYRSSALLSNSDVEIIYTTADRLELKSDHAADVSFIEESDLMEEGGQYEIINIKNS